MLFSQISTVSSNALIPGFAVQIPCYSGIVQESTVMFELAPVLRPKRENHNDKTLVASLVGLRLNNLEFYNLNTSNMYFFKFVNYNFHRYSRVPLIFYIQRPLWENICRIAFQDVRLVEVHVHVGIKQQWSVRHFQMMQSKSKSLS